MLLLNPERAFLVEWFNNWLYETHPVRTTTLPPPPRIVRGDENCLARREIQQQGGREGAFPHILLSSLRHGETYFVGCLRGHTEKFGYFQLSLNPSRAIVCVCECVLYSAPSLSPMCGGTCLALLCFGCPPPPPSASHRPRHTSTWRTSTTDWLCFGISAVVFGEGREGRRLDSGVALPLA